MNFPLQRNSSHDGAVPKVRKWLTRLMRGVRPIAEARVAHGDLLTPLTLVFCRKILQRSLATYCVDRSSHCPLNSNLTVPLQSLVS